MKSIPLYGVFVCVSFSIMMSPIQPEGPLNLEVTCSEYSSLEVRPELFPSYPCSQGNSKPWAWSNSVIEKNRSKHIIKSYLTHFEDTCLQNCKKLAWMKWRKLKQNLYSASFRGDSVVLEFDPNTGVFNTGQYNIQLATTIFTPKNIDSIPAPVMPGIPSITTLIHTMKFIRVKNIPEAMILVGSYPNEQYPRLSLPHIGTLKAFDKFDDPLDLPDVCIVFKDPYANNFSPQTMVTKLKNEIQFRVNDPNINDGGIVVLKGLPRNTDYIEISHYNQNSSNDDGIFIDFAEENCCPDWNPSLLVIPCTGDSNTYSIKGILHVRSPYPTNAIAVLLDKQSMQTIQPPFKDTLTFELKGLNPDGLLHKLDVIDPNAPDCILSLEFTAPTPPLPPIITADNVLCEHDTLTLSTGSASKYQWIGPNQFNSSNQNPYVNNVGPSFSGQYILIATDNNGCTSSSSIEIKIFPSSSNTLTLSGCDSLTVNGQVYKTSGTYSQHFLNANSCDSLLTIQANISQKSFGTIKDIVCDSAVINNQVYRKSGNYKQTLLSSHQCDSVLSIDLEVQRSSRAELNLGTCDSVMLNGKTFYQTGTYIQTIPNSAKCDSIITLNLYLPKSNIIRLNYEACDSIIINNKSYKVSGTYQQLFMNSFGCDSLLNLNINILPDTLPPIDAGKDTILCEGESVILNGVFSGNAILTWESATGTFDNNHITHPRYFPAGVGKQSIYLNAYNLCASGKDSLVVEVLPKNKLQITTDSLFDPCKELLLSVSGAQNYSWSPADKVECLDPPCSKIRLRYPGSFMLTASSTEECTEPASINLQLSRSQDFLFVPNAFSPNGDNVNDLFLPFIFCDQLEFYHLEIFDRWGNKVFESYLKEIGWNGTFNSQPMNPSVFTYLIHYKVAGFDESIKKGDVTLLK